jgi:hypothetical protein
MTRAYSLAFPPDLIGAVAVRTNGRCAIDGIHSTSSGVSHPAVGKGVTRDICYSSVCGPSQANLCRESYLIVHGTVGVPGSASQNPDPAAE